MIDEQTEKRKGSFWRELPILVVVAVLVALLVRQFVLQTFYIPSPSMEHTLNIYDRVLVNKLVYDFRDPARGEVIVFKAPATWRQTVEGEDFIKRIIGIPGDHIVCCDAQQRIMVNGKSLDEPYIYSEGGVRNAAADGPFDVTVPKGRLWVMGDHRAESGDSLQHWETSNHDMTLSTITIDSVVGRAFVVFWPMDRAKWLSVPSGFDGIRSRAGS